METIDRSPTSSVEVAVPGVSLADRFAAVRRETERRAEALGPEDQTVQSMADASPAKWHRAHMTWFFEQFVLGPHAAAYVPFDPRYAFLFNSYYVSAGPRHARPQRGLLTRPTAAEVGRYRHHVDRAMGALLASPPSDDLAHVVAIGLHHEQQHQELLVTDILHAFAQNPLRPACLPEWREPRLADVSGFVDVPAGIGRIGTSGPGFAFDNEHPSHRVLVEHARIARGLVTNRDWLEFIADGGYATPTLWLSDGWTTVASEGWRAPLYWEERDGAWWSMTPAGMHPVDPRGAVRHVSYYEADAFARWAGKRLPTEQEWELAARAGVLDDAFDVVWQWTQSAYLPYPGFRPLGGTLGEYNGKFMANQMVLRGGSCATPAGHTRATYRNFFYPFQRWQFTGLRLAEDAA